MADNPSISFPNWMFEEIDGRRGNTQRSQWIQEAAQARLKAEDAGEWSTPDINPDAVTLRHQKAVPDGGSDA